MLVSAIMPTADYGQYIGLALLCFSRQTHEDRELVIFDDGFESVEALIPADPRIRYHYQDPREASGRWAVGRKRNWCIAQAKGEIIFNWDTDDWYGDRRMEFQVARLKECGKQMTGFHDMLFYGMATPPEDKLFKWDAQFKPQTSGSSQAYYRQWALDNPYKDCNIGEDSDLSERTLHLGQLDSTPSHQLLVVRHHPDSTSPAALASWNFPRALREDFPSQFFEDIGE